jgi:hypothetical protein
VETHGTLPWEGLDEKEKILYGLSHTCLAVQEKERVDRKHWLRLLSPFPKRQTLSTKDLTPNPYFATTVVDYSEARKSIIKKVL